MTISSHFDYKEVLRRLQQKGQESFGRHFRLLKEDLPVIIPIVAWMLRDEEVAGQCKIDLNKGIYLAGPVGTGKTQLMHLMRCLTDRHYDYEVYSCPKIAIDFAYSGISAILPYTYSNMDVKRSVAAICCFDDLGKEIVSIR
ncbi:P-loop NTPase family protein [Chitinophaga agri]|uniref:AAA family ATPase n=1 Tax=Chitinophaga agri TaxID=2703787 RepID=A0A6B9ZG07_9BACT|nr:hypothetical protein [Chitinophaga agri]QHS61057.1 hypothetical protein GWR21_16055 [Chitinophaga agri]